MTPDTALIIGAGRLGLSLAAGLEASGGLREVAIVGRGPDRPPFLADSAGVAYVPVEEIGAWWTERSDARIGLVFAVDDDRLAAAADEWAGRLTDLSGPRPLVALHTSGFHSAAVLEPVGRIGGVALGGWHPLMAVAAPGTNLFDGITVGIEGEPAAVDWAGELSRMLDAVPVTIPAGGKARYHAAAVFASNYLVACLGVALSELESAAGGTVDESALLPLARAAIDNVAAHGLAAGTTGPLVRGDLHTVEGHLAALDPDRAALYRALGRELLELVRQQNSPEVHAALRVVLGEE